MSVVVVDRAKVEAAISALVPETAERLGVGLQAWGQTIQMAARRNLHPHHYTGRAERATTVSSVTDTGMSLSITVGIHGGLAPEGRPLEFGWSSTSGKQPPSQPIYEWLTGSGQGATVLTSFGGSVNTTKAGFIAGSRSGRTDQESVARGLAFIIARSIGRKGYSFGALHWLSKATVETIEQGKLALLRAVRR